MLALGAIFVSALIMRLLPAQYGFRLNEFDPYFDYYAAKFIVNSYDIGGISSLSEYFSWHDTKSWYPEGRDIARTSQVGLHFAGAILFIIVRDLLQITISLYDFLVLFPVYFGALTTFSSFLLIKRIGGIPAGLLGALIIAFSPPIISRGNLGWFKSEPFALFLSITALYLFLRAINSGESRNTRLIAGLASGLLLGYSNISWGGSQFFSIVVALTIFSLPFIPIKLSNLLPSMSLLVSSDLLLTILSPRPGLSFLTNPVGLLLLGSLLFLIISTYLKKIIEPEHYRSSLIKLIGVLGLLFSIFIGLGVLSNVTGRYLTVIYPFYRSGNPVVESVAEHFVPTGVEYIASYWILPFISGLGIYYLFKRKGVTSIFALILGITSIYIASSFTRLLVFSSITFAIFGGIGFAEIVSSILKSSPSKKPKRNIGSTGQRSILKFISIIFIIGLFSVPLILPLPGNWIAQVDVPPTIVTSGISTRQPLSDWDDALDWISNNTDDDAVIAAWWDYGYWITVIGDRTSLADNATINSTRIEQLAKMYVSNQDESLSIINSLEADYVVVFVAGQKLEAQGFTQYLLGAGGDESKMQWFMRIADIPLETYLHPDSTPNELFWSDTLLGNLFPFSLFQYVGQDGRTSGTEWTQGHIPFYFYNMKYGEDSDGPFRLVFQSDSITSGGSGIFSAVLIYEVMT